MTPIVDNLKDPYRKPIPQQAFCKMVKLCLYLFGTPRFQNKFDPHFQKRNQPRFDKQCQPTVDKRPPQFCKVLRNAPVSPERYRKISVFINQDMWYIVDQ